MWAESANHAARLGGISYINNNSSYSSPVFLEFHLPQRFCRQKWLPFGSMYLGGGNSKSACTSPYDMELTRDSLSTLDQALPID